MAQEVVQTPVEPLVLSDDRTASIKKGDLSAREERVDVRVSSKPSIIVDDDDDDADDEDVPGAKVSDQSATEPASTESVPPPVTTPRAANARVDSQNPLLFEPEAVQTEPTEPTPEQETSSEGRDQHHEMERVDTPIDKQTPAEAVVENAPPTPEPHQPVQVETKARIGTAETLTLLHAYLYQKIVENQCNSHAKEIHEFVATNLTDRQQKAVIPQVVAKLSQQFQTEAMGQEVSVDIQSSLCFIEQMLLPEGRRSPLQDMYTAEEEEMLDLLVHASSSNNVQN